MITFVKGKANRIALKVNSSIDISGFSAVLAVCGSLKTVEDITKQDIYFEFEAEDFSEVTQKPIMGTLMVCDADGKEYLEFAPWFRVVEDGSAEAILGEQVFYLTIVSTRATEGGGGGGGGEYVTKAQLTEAVEGCHQYTNEKVQGIDDSIADIQAAIADAQETHTIAHVEDVDHDGKPDGEMLYLNPSKPPPNVE